MWLLLVFFFFSSRRRHTRFDCDWSSDVCSSDLDNSDGTLPIAYKEVLVTRRLSRSGQSEYLLNRSAVRLRDIQDLLRGTGLGADAAVVMEARMIEALLSEKAEERRALFEEAAGIGLSRDRRTSAGRGARAKATGSGRRAGRHVRAGTAG